MLRIIIVIISIFCSLFLFYGLLFAVLENEPNRCRMTYMFEYPQFVRIHFSANKYYPKYGLYAYSEGSLIERTRSMDFTGAPVIFIPGNAGSYKQARSLASVAIRKGIDNGWYQHLDYFSVDFNDEYNGLFGGYLKTERNFVKECIYTVLNLYGKQSNRPDQIILIGHSMGGKIAQSLLTDDEISPLINTVITIATPIDEPVLKIDEYFATFYSEINKYLEANRSFQKITNETNYCTGIGNVTQFNSVNESLSLDDKLIISLGGGSRDYLVRSGLTASKFSDINTMTTSISNVWVSTDHLCSVWCLQLVLVLNRFLHSIIAPYSGNRKYERFAQRFIKDKQYRLVKAKHFLIKPDYGQRMREIDLPPAKNGVYEWEEDSRRVYSKIYEEGLNKTIIQMIRLVDSPNHKYLSIVAVNVEYDDNFIMGCAALDFSDSMRYCSKGTSLSKYITRIPTIGDNKIIVKLDLHKIIDNYPDWTHVIFRFNPTRKRFSYSIDIFDPASRFIKIQAPKWNSYSRYNLLDDTLYGSSFYKFEINGLEESYQSLALYITPRVCSRSKHHSVARVCIPWMKNCDKYQHFTDEENRPLYIEVPKNKPIGYNSSQNPIIIQLHSDANCRYRISYQNSFGGTMYRILHQYFHWLPAHLTGILLMAFRHQITITPVKLHFKCGKLQTALLVCSSIFIITMTRVFGKFFQMLSFLPEPDTYSDSLMVSILIHGTAFAIVIWTTLGLWLSIYIYANMTHKILIRIVKLPISLPTITDSVMPIIEKIPISAGVILVALASGSCGGLALLVGCIVYYMQILKEYEDYLEEFVYGTAKMIAEKLFGKLKAKFFKKSDDKSSDETFKTTEAIKENEESSSKEDNDTDVTDIDDHNIENDSTKTSEGATENEKGNVTLEKNETKLESERLKIDDKIDQNRPKKKEKKQSKELLNVKEYKKEDYVDEEETPPEKNPEENKNENTKQLSEKSEILLNAYDAASEQDFPENVSDAELNKLLDDAIMRQKQKLDEKRKKQSLERLEYDAVHESFSSINFHMTLLILLGVLTAINLPATISWAKNYSYNPRLSPDPSYLPAIIVLICNSILWQLGAPRNVHGYTFLSGVLYALAFGCIIYCQDSIYRLNYIIPIVFILITLQQLFFPKKPEENQEDAENELKDKIERLKNILEESGDLEKAD